MRLAVVYNSTSCGSSKTIWHAVCDTPQGNPDQEATDYSQAAITFEVDGTRFASTLGNGTIDYNSKYGDFAFLGGPFESEESVYLNFDNFGQTFDVETGSSDYSRFQHGASLERGFHQFLLNTPALGDYDCRHVDSSDQQTVRLSTGGIYETAQGSGRYTYSDIIDSTSSDMEFTGGPLDGESISYQEDALTGRQQFRISQTQTFGIAVGSSSSLTYVCARLHAPRPFKQYGYAALGAPPAPAIPFSGFYYAPDIVTSSNDSHLYADYYNFRADGFLKRDYPNSIGDDCNRTAPNGLNYCDAYTVSGSRLLITSPEGSTSDLPIEIGGDGFVSAIDEEAVEVITPSAASYINGVWLNNRYSSSGCVGGDYCSYSYSERVYRMGTDGRFIYANSSQGGSTLTTAIASSSVIGSASNDQTGNYEIHGNRLLLGFDNGAFENHFIYITQGGDLAVNGLLFPPHNDTE